MAVNRMVVAECGVGLARWDRVACMRACLTVPEMLLPSVAQTAHVISFLHAQLLLVLPCSRLSLARVWPWLLLALGTARWNLLWLFLFQPIFSRVYLMLSRVRPARLSVEQAVVQRSNLETPPARASQQP